MQIPSNNRWTQTNQGDIFGVLNETKNIYLDNAGKLQLNRKPYAQFTSNTSANFNNVIAILYFNSSYIVITSDEAFEYNAAASTFTEISGTPVMNTDGDALIFNNRLYTMGATQLSYWTGSAWTTNVLSAALTSGKPHPMTIFDSNPTFKLAIADGNKVYTYNTSHTLNTTVLTIPTQFEITSLEYRNGYLYAGTQNINGGEARIFIWKGTGTNAQYEVPVGAEWVFALTPYGSTVAAVTNNGEILQIDGASRQTLATFPIFYENNIRWVSTSTPRVNKNGMMAVKESIYLGVDGGVYNSSLPSMKSGLWKYNPNTGLNHFASFSADEYVSDTSLSLSDSTLTTSAAHNLKTGDSVIFKTVSGLTGVSSSVVYYVTVVSTTEIKLSLSRDSVNKGNYLTIGGTPVSLDNLFYTPNLDYGQLDDTAPGAIGRIVADDPLDENWTTDVLYSARVKDVNGANPYILCGIADSYNVGSFTTQRIYSENISQVWKNIYAFVENGLTNGEEIVVKHRTKQDLSKPTPQLSGVWGSANTIHSTGNAYDEDDWDILDIGDEVFIASGYGQGRTAHITKITQSVNTYVVTVDESFGNANSSLTFIADNWTKTGSHDYQRDEKDYITNILQDSQTGVWVQFKVELRGFGTKVSHLEINNQINKGKS